MPHTGVGRRIQPDEAPGARRKELLSFTIPGGADIAGFSSTSTSRTPAYRLCANSTSG